MLLLQCPNCKNRMKYQSTDGYVFKKVKKCVYCGRSFKVSENIVGNKTQNI